MPLAITTPPVKKQLRNDRSRFGAANYKNNFPLLLSERSGDNFKSFRYKRGNCNAKHRPDLCGQAERQIFCRGRGRVPEAAGGLCRFRIIELPEEKIEEKNASDAVVKKALDKEGKAILSNVRKGAAIVAMCIEGRQISSDELAQFLADRANSGAGDVAFVIGSSHGLSDEVKKAAALKFSMGRITMPHQLARLVLTEQIYRACTINAGMKYHK